MSQVKLMPHQREAMEVIADKAHSGYFLDMGLGKTFCGSEQLHKYGEPVNLVVVQKSKVDDWVEHFETYYGHAYDVMDLTKPKELESFIGFDPSVERVGVINYDILFRRPDLLALNIGTLMLDESSILQNPTTKRTKAVLKMNKQHTILLSGTVVNGKYEKLWSQAHLLGWPISKKMFYSHYTIEKFVEGGPKQVVAYKNIDRLKRKLREYGGVFMKTEDVMTLPQQTVTTIKVPTTKNYARFCKDKIVHLDTGPLVGDMQLTERLYKRLLCSHLNTAKVKAFTDLLESTEDRLVVFYNFQAEYEALRELTDRPVSVVNGSEKDLSAYEEHDNSVTFIQYQAGALGLNLQKANKVIYFTLPDGGMELFEQSKKRIHRIGQERPCFYYILVCENSIEDKDILVTLGVKKGRNDYLWET